MEKIQLTDSERLILINQYDLLRKFNPEDRKYKKNIEILENGYEDHYCELFRDMILESLPESLTREVRDILSMYCEIIVSYCNLKDEKLDQELICFAGFDGNSEDDDHIEGKLLFYTQFLFDQGLYNAIPRFQEGEDLDGYNSHTPMLAKYRAQLARYINGKNGNELEKNSMTIEQICNVLDIKQ